MPRYRLFVMRLRGSAVMVLHGLRQGTVPFCNWSRIRVVTISYTFTRCLRVASRAGLRPESPWPPEAARDGRDRRQLGLARPTLQSRSAPGGPGRTFGGGGSWPAGGGGGADTATIRAEEARFRGGAFWRERARRRADSTRLTMQGGPLPNSRMRAGRAIASVD